MEILKRLRHCLLILASALSWSATVFVATVDAPITPPILSYLASIIDEAESNNANAVVIELDTPGGLLTTTRDIGQLILTSNIPIITYVSPQGSRAASAGTFILYASPVAAMAPGTHLGSATPISLGGEEKEASSSAEQKILNDTLAYIKTLAQYHQRNEDFAIAAVQDAISITAPEALRIGVVEAIADDIPSLLQKIDGTRVRMPNGYSTLSTADASIVKTEPGLKERILIAISDPSIAYLMLMAGLYGLMIELFNPGSIFPGVIGAVCLLIASYSLQILPINYAGLGLIALGSVFLVAESFIPSFGILGIAGVISLIIGGFLIIQVPVWAAPDVWFMLTLLSLFVMALLWLIRINLRAHLNQPVSGQAALLGQPAKVINYHSGTYEVLVSGEVWQADSINQIEIPEGETAIVYGIEGLKLKIKPLEKEND